MGTNTAMRNKVINPNAINALGDFSESVSYWPEGNFLEKKNTPAAIRNNAPTQAYNIVTLSSPSELIWSSLAIVVPNNANATTIGPIAVPNELIPPPNVIRCAPVSGGPSSAANGFAAVCCKENPRATANKPASIPGKVFALTASIITTAPMAENNNP